MSEPCIPGETRGCLCGGASGAQMCLEDGASYSSCDCGVIVPAGGTSGASGVGGVGGVGGGAGGVSGGGSTGGTGGVAGEDAGVTPVTGPGTVIAAPADEAAFLWDDTTFRTFEIEVSEANLATIDADPAAEEYVEATLKFGDEVYPQVGLRYKGSVGAFIGCTSGGAPFMPSGSKTCPKLSMKVSMNWITPGGRFYGLKKLQFHSMNNDDSLMRERLGYTMFREMGIAGPRAQHVRLMINGAFAGLFLLVEEVDSRFTRSRFSEGGDGNLYKEIWPKWTGATDYAPPALQTNEDDPDLSYDRVLRFAMAMEGAAEPDGARALVEQWMDLDYTLSFIAVDRTLLHDDGMFHWYCNTGTAGSTGNNPGACSNHNYFWYEEKGWDRLWLVPWDLDLSLGNDIGGITNISTAWDAPSTNCTGAFGQLPPSCDKLTRTWATWQMRYKAEVRRLLDGPFAASNVDPKLEAWSAQISAAVDEAEAAGHSPTAAAWSSAMTSLRSTIGNRRTTMSAIAP